MSVFLLILIALVGVLLILIGFWMYLSPSLVKKDKVDADFYFLEEQSDSSKLSRPKLSEVYSFPISERMVGLILAGFLCSFASVVGIKSGVSAFQSNLFGYQEGVVFFGFLVLIIPSTLFFVFIGRYFYFTYILNQRGSMATGIVFDKWEQFYYVSRKRRPRKKVMQYCIAYYFDQPLNYSGKSRIVKAEENKEAYDLLAIGDSVQIKYLSEKPEICVLDIHYVRK